jgi:hypothetical protein
MARKSFVRPQVIHRRAGAAEPRVFCARCPASWAGTATPPEAITHALEAHGVLIPDVGGALIQDRPWRPPDRGPHGKASKRPKASPCTVGPPRFPHGRTVRRPPAR